MLSCRYALRSLTASRSFSVSTSFRVRKNGDGSGSSSSGQQSTSNSKSSSSGGFEARSSSSTGQKFGEAQLEQFENLLSNPPKDLKTILVRASDESSTKKRKTLKEVLRDLLSRNKGDTTSPEVQKKEGGWAELKRMLSLVRPELGIVQVALACLVVNAAVSMSVPWGTGRIIDIISKVEGKDITTLSQFVLVLSGVFLAGSLANFGRVYLMRLAGERIVARLRAKLFAKVTEQEIGFFDSQRTGELITRMTSDTQLVGKAFTNNVSDGLRGIIQVVAGAGGMLWVSPKLTMLIMAIIPPIAVGATIYGGFVRRLTKDTQDAMSDSNKIAEERLSNIRTVRAFAMEGKELERYSAKIADVFHLSKREALATGTFFGSVLLAGNLSILLVLFHGGKLVLENAITVGDLTTFALYTVYVGGSVGTIGSFFTEMMKGMGASARIFELLERKPSIPLTGGESLKHLDGHVSFKDVMFSYPTRPEYQVLSGLTLDLTPGTILAIVGQSGSGKSTLGHLLLRFYDPQSGTVSIDNVDVRTFDPKWLREHIGLVSQEPTLLAGTIEENIAYGTWPKPSREQVIEAARQANALSFIERFPDGLDTYVGERGIALSGGQKQRVAIARALVKNPRILILDEATSALDSESELLVREALERLMRGRTVITIAHRLSTIQSADKIAVLDKGVVAEIGTYSELVSREGVFKKIMEKQLMQ